MKKKSREKKLVTVTFTDPPKLPLAQDSGSVSEMTLPYVFHRIPGADRGRFMDEVYRVLAADGKATFVVPYWSTTRAIMDWRSEWPPVSEASFMFFNKQWRESQKVNGCSCDFDFTYGISPEAETSTRSQEVQMERIKHQINTAQDLQVVLTKRVQG